MRILRGQVSACACNAAAFEDAPEEVDITVFEAQGPEAEAISKAAAELVSKVAHTSSTKSQHLVSPLVCCLPMLHRIGP